MTIIALYLVIAFGVALGARFSFDLYGKPLVLYAIRFPLPLPDNRDLAAATIGLFFPALLLCNLRRL